MAKGGPNDNSDRKTYSKKWKNVDGLEKYCTKKHQKEFLEIVRNAETIEDVCKELDIAKQNVYARLKRLRKLRDDDNIEVLFTPIPDLDLPTDQMWEYRKRQYAQKHAHEEALKLLPVKVQIDGPIGILHFGDPHVDDDGTDLATLERHCHAVADTEGLFGANVGDTTNAWVGRMARLYGEQGTTEAQAWALAEHFLHLCPDADPKSLDADARKRRLSHWIYLIGGNHDAWRGAGDPINWITRQAAAPYTRSQVRLAVTFPNGRVCRVNARHDFSGTSQWNPAHGSMKASQMGYHDHILVNGHKHKSGYGLIKDPAAGTVSHCIQVASYKVHDRYAKDKGFPDQHISPSVVTIIDPEAPEAGFVQVFHDVDAAVDFLKWKRNN
jgi:hypothetical protein